MNPTIYSENKRAEATTIWIKIILQNAQLALWCQWPNCDLETYLEQATSKDKFLLFLLPKCKWQLDVTCHVMWMWTAMLATSVELDGKHSLRCRLRSGLLTAVIIHVIACHYGHSHELFLYKHVALQCTRTHQWWQYISPHRCSEKLQWHHVSHSGRLLLW